MKYQTIHEVCESKSCYGCEACYNVCPFGAIDQIEDEAGFLYPLCNDKCVDCKKCMSVCPANVRSETTNSYEKYFGISSEQEDILISSASGGVFSFIVHEFLKCYPDGWICGAVYNDAFSGVEHIVSKDHEDFKRMQSSKYLQSHKSTIYRDIEQLLLKNEAVLFTGAACEIDALNLYLNREYDKLWTIDYICKGTGSPKIFRDYISLLKNKYKSDITYVNMRYKWKNLDNWIPQYICVKFKNKRRFLKQFYDTEIGLGFKILQRDGCSGCVYRENKHYSNFTIGDFHGPIQNTSFGNFLGTSVLIINDENSYSLWESMDKKVLKYEEISFSDIYKYNRNNIDDRRQLLKQRLRKLNGVIAVKSIMNTREKIKTHLPNVINRYITMRGREKREN